MAHRLHGRATSLSAGQQQRLCIARSLAVEPRIILFDEPTSALDPLSTRSIEDLIVALAKEYTIVFVTHDIMQARRIAEYLVFICEGEVIEQGRASTLFASPQKLRTREYLNQGFCDC